MTNFLFVKNSKTFEELSGDFSSIRQALHPGGLRYWLRSLYSMYSIVIKTKYPFSYQPKKGTNRYRWSVNFDNAFSS